MNSVVNTDFLTRVREATEIRIARLRLEESEAAVRARVATSRIPGDFKSALVETTGTRIIAEIKVKSPSQGILVEEPNVTAIAEFYAQYGAVAVSVLTEPTYFGGSLENLQKVRTVLPTMPLLMKDFVLDSYQLLLARLYGADSILLIYALLGKFRCKELLSEARSLGLTPLVEIHDREELEGALELGADVIGINNRNLRTLQIDLNVTRELVKLRRSGAVFISESGFQSRTEINELEHLGVDAFLVGTRLMKDPCMLEKLLGMRNTA